LVSVAVGGEETDRLLEKEWLLTNRRGGYACGTVTGCNTRKYHGLLVGSLNPPVNRIVALANCLETVTTGGEFPLSTFEFERRLSPQGWRHLQQFERGSGVRFKYEVDGIKLTKSVYLDDESDTVALVWEFESAGEGLEFTVRPLVALRDFHSVQKSYANLTCEQKGNVLMIRHSVPYSCELWLHAEDMTFEQDGQWWYNFFYRKESERGEEALEDLWSPGVFRCRLTEPGEVVLWGHFSDGGGAPEAARFDLGWLSRKLAKRWSFVLKSARGRDERVRSLYVAAEQFVAEGQRGGKKPTATIMAGFPWFADWGRDALMGLPGLLLVPGRLAEAESVLTTFAEAVEEGVVPNYFDDYSNTAHYNSIDASLWFIHAVFEYLQSGGSGRVFGERFLPVVLSIVDWYGKGTKFGIRADSDGLITGGGPGTQLTWMDVKCSNEVFTARHGKAVEVNALWYSGLCRLAEFYRDTNVEAADRYGLMAEQVAESFCRLFWNESGQHLYDCIGPDGLADGSVRPNQIFAVSLPFSALSERQQQQVVQKCLKELLTAYGLRTLSAQDGRYQGRYIGARGQRDRAYHQGTVWPQLIGPFVEAYLKVNGFSRESKREAMKFIEPLLGHVVSDGCIGSVSEIFDGDWPHLPRGCIAQAWAVGELLRAYNLITT
jgi:predicted glycogen debranching enzyme